MTRRIALLMLLAIANVPVFADGWSGAYPQSRLGAEQPRLERRINELFLKGMQPFLSSTETRALRGVRLEVPLRGEVTGDPTDFYTAWGNGRARIVMPVLSLLFVEDLSTAYAWLWANGYSLETIDEYITMLRYRPPRDFPGGRYPTPLEALRVPADAWDDPRVDDLSLRLRNTAYAFILAHELGHVRNVHVGYDDIDKAQARRNELAADRFALDLLQRTATLPMGAVLYFQAQAYYMPSRGRFMVENRGATEGDWQAYLAREQTHPLTAERLRAMALYLDRDWRARDRDVAAYIGAQLYQVSEILEIEELQGCMASVAARADPRSLAPRRARVATGDLMLRWCQRNG